MSSIPNSSADTPRARVARLVSRYLERDDESRASLWITDPRWSVATTVSDLGAALARLGHRMHHDVAGDYNQGHHDGMQVAGTYAAVIRPTTREDVARMLSSLDIDASDENLAKLGY